jgi:hypothetical protein
MRRPKLRRGQRLRWRYGANYARAAAHLTAAAAWGEVAALGSPRGVFGAMHQQAEAIAALAPRLWSFVREPLHA